MHSTPSSVRCAVSLRLPLILANCRGMALPKSWIKTIKKLDINPTPRPNLSAGLLPCVSHGWEGVSKARQAQGMRLISLPLASAVSHAALGQASPGRVRDLILVAFPLMETNKPSAPYLSGCSCDPAHGHCTPFCRPSVSPASTPPPQNHCFIPKFAAQPSQPSRPPTPRPIQH